MQDTGKKKKNIYIYIHTNDIMRCQEELLDVSEFVLF